MQMGIVYGARCLINNKIYIGKTFKTLEGRKRDHYREAHLGSQKHFHRALRKYAINDFDWFILYKNIHNYLLSDIETRTIKSLNTFKNGYNATLGGEGAALSNAREDTQKIIDRYLKGEGCLSISRDYDCSRSTIKTILKDNGIRLRKRKREDVFIDSDKIIDRYLKGETSYQIGADYNCCSDYIIYILRENSIKIRSSGKPKHKSWNYQEDICNQYIKGKTAKEISRKYDCNPETISRILKSNNIKIQRGRKCQ